jgi:hypothetical protein
MSFILIKMTFHAQSFFSWGVGLFFPYPSHLAKLLWHNCVFHSTSSKNPSHGIFNCQKIFLRKKKIISPFPIQHSRKVHVSLTIYEPKALGETRERSWTIVLYISKRTSKQDFFFFLNSRKSYLFGKHILWVQIRK